MLLHARIFQLRATDPPGASSRRRLRVLGALALAAAASVALGACGGAGAAKGTLVLYNGQHVQTTDALVAAFERATGIHVEVRSDDEDTLADEILTEGAASPAGVIYTENSPALEYLQQRGLLARLPSAILARTPSRYDSPQGDWVGVSARVSVLIYNPSLISASALPGSVLALADPRYRGKLALAPGETDFQPIVTAVEHAYGRARALRWLEGMRDNADSRIYPDNEAVTADVNRGQAALGIINQYYWYRLRAEIGAANVHSRIAYFAPRDPGYVVDVSGAAVLAHAPDRQAAQRCVASLVSRQGQETIAHSQSFEYPLADGVAPAAPETPFADLRPYPILIAQLGDGEQAIALLREAGLL
jgi:iron(III) transport system substrate-binding protein